MAANPTHLTSKTKAPKKTISFRIEPEILDKLGDASSQDEITLNTLVNHVLGDYLSWDRPALKSGWIQIKKEVAKSMMDRLGEKEIQHLAIQAAKEVTKDTLLSMRGRDDLKTWLEITRLRSTKSGFIYQESKKDSLVSIIIKHEMGLKWSLFHKWYYGAMIRDLGCSTNIDYTDKTLVIKIKKPFKILLK